jgi:hypothetical protein
MKKLLLERIRLSWYFVGFFVIYFGLLHVLPRETFTAGALTLFSVNSFLYGFYISPVLGAQKSRIEELHKVARSEANAIFAMALSTKNLPDGLRNDIQEMLQTYMKQTKHDQRKKGEETYETLITFCVKYKGDYKADVEKLLDKLVANQQNRTALSMQLSNKVFNNEWQIMLVLFFITLSFILLINTGSQEIYKVVTALLATGLSMLVINLVKLNSLTHKKAKQMWQPFTKLIDSHFYRLD